MSEVRTATGVPPGDRSSTGTRPQALAWLKAHRVFIVAAVQHLAGLVVAMLCYALPRRAGLPVRSLPVALLLVGVAGVVVARAGAQTNGRMPLPTGTGTAVEWARGVSGLLPLVMSVTLIVAAAAATTAELGYRYVLVAVSLACLAAGLAVATRSRGGTMPTSSVDRIPRGGGIP